MNENKTYKIGSSIYIVDTLRIEDSRIDDQSSMLRSSIYTVSLLKRLSKRLPKRLSTISRPAMERVPDAVVEKYDSADTRNISELQDLSHF